MHYVSEITLDTGEVCYLRRSNRGYAIDDKSGADLFTSKVKAGRALAAFLLSSQRHAPAQFTVAANIVPYPDWGDVVAAADIGDNSVVLLRSPLGGYSVHDGDQAAHHADLTEALDAYGKAVAFHIAFKEKLA